MRCSSVQGILGLSLYRLQSSNFRINTLLFAKEFCISNLVTTPFLPLSIYIKVSHSTNYVPSFLLWMSPSSTSVMATGDPMTVIWSIHTFVDWLSAICSFPILLSCYRFFSLRLFIDSATEICIFLGWADLKLIKKSFLNHFHHVTLISDKCVCTVVWVCFNNKQ